VLCCAVPAEQIGYDGRSVDVWASGILLLVMLLGSFPFDHTGGADGRAGARAGGHVSHCAQQAYMGLLQELVSCLLGIFPFDHVMLGTRP